jgi:tricarballylate dehydrogenase
MANAKFDLLVAGGGCAALCAALSAREHGARVLVLERAPREERGGNSAFAAGGFRVVYHGLDDASKFTELTDEQIATTDFEDYTAEKYLDDLMRTTEYRIDPALAQVMVGHSTNTLLWLVRHGVRFVPRYGSQAFLHEGRHRFFGGLVVGTRGGEALMDALYQAAEKQGIKVRYDAQVMSLLHGESGVEGAHIVTSRGEDEVRSRAVVLASGGFESNPEWRKLHMGAAWEHAKVRGTRYNTGDGIRMALEIGAQPFGEWSGAHTCEWDVNAPAYGDREIAEAYSKHSYPLGVLLNANGERFLDEGADIRNFTYAKYGRVIMDQPQQLAWQAFDAKVTHLLAKSYRISKVTRVSADTLEQLAQNLDGVNHTQALKTLRDFNAAVMTEVPFNPTAKDGRGTRGLTIPKSNWAQSIDTPPFEAFAVTGGISFTFGGIKINTKGQVIDKQEKSIAGLYAAGELVGGIFYNNYPGGSGLTCSAVFGRVAGASAAQYALENTK